MQAYSFSARNPVSRSKGQSAIAKAAYNAREAIRDERTDKVKDYSRTHDNVLFSGIFIDPKRKVPDWAQDRAQLWNHAAAAEKYKNAQEAQEFIVALPHQLTQQGRENIVKDFMRETIMRQTGRVADVNMHRPPKNGDERNYHVHILLTMRDIGPDGFGALKAAQITPDQLDVWKEKFAQRAAKELKREGFALEADRWNVGHLSKPEQRKDAMRRSDFEHAAWAEMDATTHRGPAATDMDRKAPGSSDRANVEREKKAANVERMKLQRELAALNKLIESHEQRRTLDEIDRLISVGTKTKIREEIDCAFSEREPVQTEATAKSERSLGRTDGEIRMSFTLTPSASGFAKALEDRGLILAQITPEDIAKNRTESPLNPLPPRKPKELWMSQTGGFERLSEDNQAKASEAYGRWKDDNDSTGRKRFDLHDYVGYVQTKWAKEDHQQARPEARPVSRLERAAGGLAVVNSFGHVHTLIQHNTGQDRKQLETYLKGIDRAPLLSVADARRVMGDIYQHRKDEQRHVAEERREQSQAFGNLLVDRASTQAINDPRVIADGRAFFPEAHKDALANNRIAFARVTQIEADRSHREAAFAKELGGYQKEYKAGEIVIIREPGKSGPEANRVYRVDQDTAKDYLRSQRADYRNLWGIDDVKQSLNERAAERNQQWMEQRREQSERFGNSLIDRAAGDAINDPRQAHGDFRFTAAAFKDALGNNRLAFAQVSEEEAERSRHEAGFAKEVGGYRKEYQAGEIVIVREPGKNADANRVHKVDQEKAEDYLRVAGMDASQLQNVERTEKAMSDRGTLRQQRSAAAKARPSLGPQSAGLAAHQAWANRKAKWAKPKEEERPLRPDDYTEKQRKERDTSVIDPELYKTDPDYKRQVKNAQSYSTPEEKKQQRESDLRQLREQRER